MVTSLTERYKVAALFLIVLLGLVLRLRGLDSVGLNEDEVHKVEAAGAYLRGDFLVNRDHPMLMKSLITISLAAADLWNRGSGQAHQVADEFAVRLPNVIFGSLTAVVIFLFAQEFFGAQVGLLSALLWSIGTIAITVNRLAKEDTLLVFFTWLAYYLYLRAKKVATSDPRRAEKFYAASGGSFGLMLASKYFPNYLGLNFLYYYFFADKEKYPSRHWRDTAFLLGACALVFVVANPVILLPSTLNYMLHYVGAGTVTHHGYLMMGRLYLADPGRLRGGMPIYFYPLFLGIKTPLPLLGALMIGLVETWKRRREPGPFFLIFMFLSWVIPFSVAGSKWLRYMLSWMPIVYIITAIGLARLFSWSSALSSWRMNRRLAPALIAAIALVFVVEPAWVSVKSAPYYSLYLNPLGGGRTGYYFPHDEVNDMGLREAIKEICRDAPNGATVGGEAKPVFAYYFHKFGRDDLHYFDLSDQVKRAEAPPSAYLVVQEGRKYLENIVFIQRVERYQTPLQTFDIGGAHAARVYRDQEFAALRMGR